MMIHFHVITFGQIMTKNVKAKTKLEQRCLKPGSRKRKSFFLDIDPPSNNQYETKKTLKRSLYPSESGREREMWNNKSKSLGTFLSLSHTLW